MTPQFTAITVGSEYIKLTLVRLTHMSMFVTSGRSK